jgi:CheY-like chemotaxis protein/anti-sigma regulatory factor (Ser/Thr protein kinase)
MSQSILSRSPRRVPGDPRLRERDERLESLKAVVGKLAHDFNNFLVPQFGYLTLLKDELAAGSTSAQYAANMETAGRRTEGYIESILLGMRPHRQFSPSEFSLGSLVASALEQWTAGIPAATAVEVKRQIEECKLVGDEKQWRNVIEHLLSNARYALATGGRLEVELKQEVLDGAEIKRLGLETERVYRLVVRDRGFGMPSEVLQRAFEPFFTTRSQVKAPGLGLTIVHSVVQFHGGQVELESAEEQGTTVTVWVPTVGSAGRERLASVGGFKSRGLAQKKKVLLVEDDPLVNEVLRDWLGRFELDVQVAATAEEALKQLERKGSNWALIIVETDLRAGKGEEIYARLAGANPALPWIFLAGRRRPEFTTVEAGSGTPLVLQKPVTLRALGEVVRKHVTV